MTGRSGSPTASDPAGRGPHHRTADLRGVLRRHHKLAPSSRYWPCPGRRLMPDREYCTVGRGGLLIVVTTGEK